MEHEDCGEPKEYLDYKTIIREKLVAFVSDCQNDIPDPMWPMIYMIAMTTSAHLLCEQGYKDSADSCFNEVLDDYDRDGLKESPK